MTMARKKAPQSDIPIDTIRHPDKRTNIPTEELRGFVEEDEKAPKTMLYPRDPSLDPQLVWKGKDEQDQKPLEVPVLPIYIQEKIHSKVIIEDFLAQIRKAGGVKEATATYQASLDLFGDFNGLPDGFDQRVDFYHHEQNWSNRLILGDSLQVMTSLAEKEGLKGKVQMIYIDPPYGIKFNSNWQVSTRERGVRDGKAEDVTRQPEQIRAFRDTWKLGVHSYLAYLRDRLQVARDLLTETGSVFVQIGDENVHLVRCLMDEVFGSQNFCSHIVFKKTGGFSTDIIQNISDSILWYSKEKKSQGRLTVKYHPLFLAKNLKEGPGERYTIVENPNGLVRTISNEEVEDVSLIPKDARLLLGGPLTSDGASTTLKEFVFRGRTYIPKSNQHWKTDVDKGFVRLSEADRIFQTQNFINYKLYFYDFPYSSISNIWADTMGTAERNKIYVVQTVPKIIERCLLMTTDPGDLVLDPTCGSGTTAYVAEQWGRRWISIDTSRVALALARTRIMSARYPYYLLVDSQEGIQKEAELTGLTPPMYNTKNDIKKNFVYQRIPHIQLNQIAKNEEIDTIYAKWQEKMEPLRHSINKKSGKVWEDWELPREFPENKEVHALLQQWWEMRLKRQKEIDESISRRADMELLYDKPFEDPRRVRVTGPFTVESLSPHRILPADEDMDGTVTEEEARKHQDYATIIFDNLRTAGVQNTVKNERIKFDFLEPHPGKWIHAQGAYTDAEGTTRRVAISLGPEHGTVGPLQLKEAAKEAVQGIGFDVLLVCGFAFDPHVSEDAKHYGKLTVLPTRMNPDLSMGDDLLKKTGAGNLFMVFGDPDIEIRKDGQNSLIVEIIGFDVFDPTTGQIRISSTDDIACWFIDTDYNEESFFVRQAYFTGKDKPYDKLKRALRAEVDEDAWTSLYRTVSLPFPVPKSGKIAVKVINHYGDEVLKVYVV